MKTTTKVISTCAIAISLSIASMSASNAEESGNSAVLNQHENTLLKTQLLFDIQKHSMEASLVICKDFPFCQDYNLGGNSEDKKKKNAVSSKRVDAAHETIKI
ncbi:hypothetical protein PN836_011345 [Ningiella sp. W23]|uniref:hypothetical protein n=1 Tax=Ningiella sp. W23 TaxID=3023715 RepID=UPI003756FF07